MGVVNIPNMPLATATTPGAMSAAMAAKLFVSSDGLKFGIGNSNPDAVLAITGATTPQIRLRGPSTQAPMDYYFETGSDFGTGIFDDIGGWIYNREMTATNQPIFGEQFESRFATQWPPGGALERHSNYTSIDRTVSYRPWMFAIDLNTHESETVYQGHRKFQIIDYTQTKSITYTSSIDTLSLTGILSCAKVSAAELSSPNGFVILTQTVASGVIDLLALKAGKSDALGTGNALTWYGSRADGNQTYAAGSIYSTFDGATWDTARTTIRSRDAAGNPLETLNVLNGRIAITGLWGGTTLKPAGLRVEGTISGIAWRDTVETGSHRNFAILNSWSSTGCLDFIVSAAAGGNPGSILLQFDGPNYAVVLPQLAGTGTRHVVVDANGKLSAP